jgi:hypothetical protein
MANTWTPADTVTKEHGAKRNRVQKSRRFLRFAVTGGERVHGTCGATWCRTQPKPRGTSAGRSQIAQRATALDVVAVLILIVRAVTTHSHDAAPQPQRRTVGVVAGIRLAAVTLACKQFLHSNVMESKTFVAGHVEICQIRSVEITAAQADFMQILTKHTANNTEKYRGIVGLQPGIKHGKSNWTNGFENAPRKADHSAKLWPTWQWNNHEK